MKTAEINVDAIMREIKEKAALREHQLGAYDSSPSQHTGKSFSAAHIPPPTFKLEIPQNIHLERPGDDAVLEYNQSYTLTDLLNFHDSTFIRNAYRGILGREPDQQGNDYYLTKLRSGDFNKIEILGRLRYAAEGRYLARNIRGLFLPFAFNTLCRIPILGYLMRLAVGVLQVPFIVKSTYQFEAHMQCQLNQTKDNLINSQNLLEAFLNKTNAHLKDALDWLLATKADKQTVTHLADEITVLIKEKADQEELAALRQSMNHLYFTKANKEAVNQLQQQLAEFSTVYDGFKMIQNHIEHAKQQLVAFEQKILDKENEFTQVIEKLEDMLVEEEPMRETQYVSFEEHFRGTREEVKERQRIYLSYLEKMPADIKSMTMLDLGCGRGEWLELLKENNYTAIGVDVNKTMIQKCSESGFTAVADDAINYLKNLEADSVGIITGFHLIEHLSFKNRMRLFDEALRVLKPGGAVIFETPNPENLIVGACEFYSDPTHKRPIPPTALKYFMETRGFYKTEIVRVNKDEQPLTDNPMLEKLLDGEKDYAVIGYKAD